MKRKLVLEKKDWFVFNPGIAEEKTFLGLIHPRFNKIHIYYRQCGISNYSSICHAVMQNNKVSMYAEPVLEPKTDYEKHGVEDPRITRIGSTYFMLYVGYDGVTARVMLATSKDLLKWQRKHMISPNLTYTDAIKLAGSRYYAKRWEKKKHRRVMFDKDAVLFPKKINGKYAMLHRLDPAIQIIYFDDFSDLKKKSFWRKHIKNIEANTIMKPKFRWEAKKIGAGTILETKKGWLLFYHGVRGKPKKSIYTAGIALLDLKDPKKVIARYDKELFKPDYEWEKKGQVNYVVFPTGAVLHRGIVKLFYGAADARIGMAEIPLEELFNKLKV
jgi:predicted GH43/DUF377 family glycosyl hydrolase